MLSKVTATGFPTFFSVSVFQSLVPSVSICMSTTILPRLS